MGGAYRTGGGSYSRIECGNESDAHFPPFLAGNNAGNPNKPQ